MLRLANGLTKILKLVKHRRTQIRPKRSVHRFNCEFLESRELLSGGLGTDYTLMGGQWDNSSTITFSIAPDGVTWDQGTNNVNASLGSEYGGNGWQELVARALQTWAASTNLNFSQVPDGPFGFNTPGINQGDPDFGDIRIGGYDLGTSATIARTYGPPPNGQTGAGDVELNTSFNFAPGSHYDFESVILHELGHSLGLGESPQPSSVMYTYYSGIRQSLSPYDIEGIQSLYGARLPDTFQSHGLATSPATALDLTPLLNTAEQGQLAGMSLATIGGVEYFSVVAPALTGSMLKVAAIAQGFSLLSPKISVIDPSTGLTLAADAHPDQYGDISLASVPNVQAGHRYLITVIGATSDVFSVGSYGIQLGFFGGTALTPPPPTILPDVYSYNNSFAAATNLGVNTQPTLGNLTLPSSLSYQVFSFQVTQPGLVLVASLGADIIVVNSTGQDIVGGSGLLGFHENSPGSRFYLILLPANGAPVNNYAFAVRTPVTGSSLAKTVVSASIVIPDGVEVEAIEETSPSSNTNLLSSLTPQENLRKTTRPTQ